MTKCWTHFFTDYFADFLNWKTTLKRTTNNLKTYFVHHFIYWLQSRYVQCVCFGWQIEWTKTMHQTCPNWSRPVQTCLKLFILMYLLLRYILHLFIECKRYVQCVCFGWQIEWTKTMHQKKGSLNSFGWWPHFEPKLG